MVTWEEQEKILAVAPPRVRVLRVLGVETGMRTGEMLGLRWGDVDFLKGGKEQNGFRNKERSHFTSLQVRTAQVA